MDSDQFLNWFRYAINRVGPGYFGHAERVYCYELYHYIRVAMHYHEQRSQTKITDVFLHSELVKTVLSIDDAKIYEVWPLGSLRMPDFLFHTPGNFENQIAAVEVKTASLSSANLLDDLFKLTELRLNYRYQLGIFHCVNTDTRELIRLLRKADALQMALDPNIQIECKPSYGAALQSCRLGDLLT